MHMHGCSKTALQGQVWGNFVKDAFPLKSMAYLQGSRKAGTKPSLVLGEALGVYGGCKGARYCVLCGKEGTVEGLA